MLRENSYRPLLNALQGLAQFRVAVADKQFFLGDCYLIDAPCMDIETSDL